MFYLDMNYDSIVVITMFWMCIMIVTWFLPFFGHVLYGIAMLFDTYYGSTVVLTYFFVEVPFKYNDA